MTVMHHGFRLDAKTAMTAAPTRETPLLLAILSVSERFRRADPPKSSLNRFEALTKSSRFLTKSPRRTS